jgi:thioredoxin 1
MSERGSGSGAADSRTYRLAVVAVLAIAVGAVLFLRADRPPPATEAAAPAPAATPADPSVGPLPRLVDLGADKCIPCKMMAPILEEMRREYEGRFEVVFIDVWKNRAEAQNYGIRVIPTQIFYDGAGRELFRHEGFFSREDILATWRTHGYDFMTDESPRETS